jgi:hypothetical protein
VSLLLSRQGLSEALLEKLLLHLQNHLLLVLLPLTSPYHLGLLGKRKLHLRILLLVLPLRPHLILLLAHLRHLLCLRHLRDLRLLPLLLSRLRQLPLLLPLLLLMPELLLKVACSLLI